MLPLFYFGGVMRSFILAILLLWAGIESALARDVLTLRTGDYVFDADPKFSLGKQIVLDDIRDDNRGIELIHGFIDLPAGKKFPFVVRTSSGLRNGFAVIASGVRYIVFDYDWYSIGDTAGHLLLVGHEVGHHVCGHTLGTMTNDPWAKELEADQFGGAAIRKLGHPELLREVISAAQRIYPIQGSTTHPPRAQRIAAITEGYNNGSLCVQRGYITFEDITDEERRAERLEAEKQEAERCLYLAREFCRAKNIKEKANIHGNVKYFCGVIDAFVFIDQRTNRKMVGFPGVDCVSGGRFKKEGVSTVLPVQ